MRILQGLAAILAAVLLSGPALAARDAPPDPAKVAAARAQADAAIARLNLGDQFENATESTIGELRHKPSGLICSLGNDPAAFAVSYNPALPAGDDVTCSYDGLGPSTWRATRPGGKPKLDGAIGAELKFLEGFTGVAMYKGPVISARSDVTRGLQIGVARLTAEDGGKPVFIRISVMIIGDWLYVQKIIVPKDDGPGADLIGEIDTILMIGRIRDHGPAKR